jgi:hypothetical protein
MTANKKTLRPLRELCASARNIRGFRVRAEGAKEAEFAENR